MKTYDNIAKDMLTDRLQDTNLLIVCEVEEIEHVSRDGFIANPYNNGGVVINGFSDVEYIVGSGSYPAHDKARQDINRIYEDLCECFTQAELESGQCELDPDGQCSVMYQLRVMYHPQDDDGVYSASVSAVVNTEGPYHRSSISWAPSVFCEGSKEIKIEYRTVAEFETKLKDSLDLVIKEIF